MRGNLLNIIEGDGARERALQDLLSAVISAYEEEPELDKRLNGYLQLVPHLKEVFERKIEVKVGRSIYPLEILKVEEEELLSFFENVKGKWIIAVDESQHTDEFFMNHSYFYRSSLAYALKVNESKDDKERILGVISSFKVSEETSLLKDKLDLQTYIQNLIVALYAFLILVAMKEEVYAIFIDGPLIRDLHHFLFITFGRKELEKLFNIDPEIEKEVSIKKWLKEGIYSSFLKKKLTVKDFAKGKLLDYILTSPIYEEILEQLQGERKLKLFFSEIANWDDIKKGKVIPGLIIYFFLLRLLSDMVREKGALVSGIVKASHRSKEFLRFYYSRALAKLAERDRHFRFKLYATELFDLDREETFSERLKRGEISRVLLEEMSLVDDHLMTFCLNFSSNSANLTSPFEIRRHRSRRVNREEVFEIEKDFRVRGISPYGSASGEEQDFWLESILLENILPQDSYRFFMTYVRTSDLKFPLRIEFPESNWERAIELASVVYVLSSVYRNYGIPIVLKYVDNLVRVSTRMIQYLSKGLLKEKLLKELIESVDDSEPAREIVKNFMYGLKRGFFSR